MDKSSDDLEKIIRDAEKALQAGGLDDAILGHDYRFSLKNTPRDTLDKIIEGTAEYNEKELETLVASGVPSGEALEKKLIQIKSWERSTFYKSDTMRRYQSTLKSTAELYYRISEGQIDTYDQISTLVSVFMDLLEKDRALLINLSTLSDFQREEDYLFSHALNVCLLSLALATSCGYTRQEVIDMGVAGLLLDVGMLKVPKQIRTKEGLLIPAEKFEIEKHPILGSELLREIRGMPAKIPLTVYQHHERETGDGYPKNRRGHLIHPFSKMAAISDVFEALTSPRKYREPVLPYKAMELLLKQSSTGKFSRDSMKNFVQYLSLFPIGSYVRLNNGSIAKVIESNGNQYTLPVVSLLTNSKGGILAPQEFMEMDLSKTLHLKITEPLSPKHLNFGILDGF